MREGERGLTRIDGTGAGEAAGGLFLTGEDRTGDEGGDLCGRSSGGAREDGKDERGGDDEEREEGRLHGYDFRYS